MLTPNFKLDQTEDTLKIIIKAPYANVAQAEIDVNENQFCFSSWPYFLRLHLPGPIEETAHSKGKYDSDTGTFSFELSKKNQSEFFPHLDLIGSFLTPKPNKQPVKPNIEVLASVNNENVEEKTESDEEDEWLIEQTLPEETETLLPTVGEYGFANQSKGVLERFPSDELTEIFDLNNPDQTSSKQKMELQKVKETAQFNEDYYLADLMEPPKSFQTILAFEPDWSQSKFTEENIEMLKNLGNKEYLLTSKEENAVFCSLIDILFAFAYDHRTTEGTLNSESVWTVNKLSATLSWLRSFTSLKEAVVSCFRRSLCYPLYRHWDLSSLVFKDVINILASGHNQIVMSLLQVYSMFQESEPRYLLNQLYIKDYIIWVQQVPDNKLESLKSLLEMIKIEKKDVDLELAELEYAAYLLKKEEEEELINNLMSLHLSQGETSSSAYDSSDTSGSSEQSSSSDTDDEFSLVESKDCSYYSADSTNSENSLDSDDYSSYSEEV